jgi:hypothetical protein
MGGDLVEVRTVDLPGYRDWSDRLADEYPAEVAHLDATSVLLPRAELATVTPAFFDALLAELRGGLGRRE